MERNAQHQPASLARRMDLVQRHREALDRLQDRWDQLALLAQMSGIAGDIGTTAAEFAQLTDTLLSALAERLYQNALAALRAKSQVGIDILVRNLFERTADVGFLAMDGEVCAFAQEAAHGPMVDKHNIVRRLQAYVRKYTVYDDVVVLGVDGCVLARLDETVNVQRSSHPLVAASLRGDRPFVESFGQIDVLGGRQGLVYSTAIRISAHSSPLGVLCLSFKLDNEWDGICRGLLNADEPTQLVLLDESSRVLASSDAWQMPRGAPLRLDADNGGWSGRTMFAGREYLAVATASAGYQGYGGPTGWRIAALVPLDLAFDAQRTSGPRRVDFDTSALNHVALFGDELERVPQQARHMQRGLELSVWNGQLRAGRESRGEGFGGNRFAAALLGQVADSGARIRNVFEAAIGDLQQSAVTEVLRQAHAASALAVDIMDRNLYERANDCRWWALDGSLRHALENPADASAQSAAQRTLAHINGLYTVYSQLLLLDARGEVVAASQAASDLPCAHNQTWFTRALSLGDDQGWARSSFEPSAFYTGRSTYVYAASVRSGHASAGCVAIVFDSEPQLAAMLRDALPRAVDGQPLPQASALFATRSGEVVASTHEGLTVGDRLPFYTAYSSLARGASGEQLLTVDGATYAMAASMAGGYREYGADSNASPEDVACIVLIRLCEAQDSAKRRQARVERFEPRALLGAPKEGHAFDLATFAIDGHWYGLPAQHVVAAVQVDRLPTLPDARQSGLLLHEGLALSVGSLGQPSKEADPLIVVCQLPNGRRFGLRVHHMGTVCPSHTSLIQPIPSGVAALDPTCDGLLRGAGHDAHDDLMTLLNVERLARRVCGEQPNSVIA